MEKNDDLLQARIVCSDGTIVTVPVADAATAIGKLPEGVHSVSITGEISTNDLAAITDAIKSNPNGAKVILDMGATTGLGEIPSDAFKDCANLFGIVISEGVTVVPLNL